MSELTPQQQGRDWEEAFAKSIGGRRVVMSGAGFSKLDVDGQSLLWSLKHTVKQSFRLNNDLMREALDAIYGPGGTGNALPGIALCIDGQEYVLLRKEDALYLMSERPGIAPASKNGQLDLSRRKSPLLESDPDE